MTPLVVTVDAAVTAPLRQRVLRPHQSVDEMEVSLGDGATTVHVAAYVDDQVVGSGSIRPEAPLWDAKASEAWRVRGMATAPDHRGEGIGTAVLDRLIHHAVEHGGRLVWCSARIPARSLYERAGFSITGEPWVDPVIGPHVYLQRAIW